MPSSGPHPDADRQHDTEDDTPMHRHLIVFSYRVLHDYLRAIGFSHVHGRGFGLYRFPVFMQPVLVAKK